MRLLIATFDPPENVGGVEGRAGAYARELAKAGHFVEIVALAPGYSFSSGRVQGAPLRRYPSSWRQTPRSFRAAAAELRGRSLDSVFLLSGALTLFGALMLCYARLTGRKSLVFIYGKDLLGARSSPVQRCLLVASALLTRRVAVNSRFTAGLLPAFVSRKVGVLYPGMDPETAGFAGPGARPPRSGRTVLFVGRLVQRKGVDDLLRAFASLPASPRSQLVVVGDGPDRARLEAMAHSLGLDGRVEFRGTLRGRPLSEAYASADVLGMPSRATRDDVEGFGTVFIEAALFGTPSVGTRSGGIPEAIEDGTTGLLVPEGDAKGLSEALRLLLEDDALRSRLGEAARARAASGFTWAKSAERLVALLS